MNILYIGDVMGELGIAEVEKQLPLLVREKQIDLVIAQAENVSEGKGMTPIDMARLQSVGVQFFTGGNHTPRKPELYPFLNDPGQPVVGPANMHDCPGPGYKYVDTSKGRVLVISLLGSTVGREIGSDNPLKAIDMILSDQVDEARVATVVNFHGDYSSEKVIIGHYLDGRVTAVIGDHWHVPTADAQVLPKGTAHMTDIGMTGSLDSSLGVTFDSVIPRWRDGIQTKNQLESAGRIQFNALLVTTNESGNATSVEHIRSIS
jgi:2',3'-cyclic-nucleotide 2'-phosphodiesterase